MRYTHIRQIFRTIKYHIFTLRRRGTDVEYQNFATATSTAESVLRPVVLLSC